MFKKLASTDGALPDLITNFNTTAGALAAESTNLSASIQQLAPTLEEAQPALRHLNNALPPFRRLAIELEPGVRQLPATIKAGSPWLVQTRKLLRQNELGGTASLLASAAPPLAKTTHATLKLFPQVSLTSRCVTHNLVPLGNEVVEQRGRRLSVQHRPARSRGNSSTASSNLAGESQGFDGNGSFVRFQAGGGPQLVSMPNPNGGPGPPPTGPLFGYNISDAAGHSPQAPHQERRRPAAPVPHGRPLLHAGGPGPQRPGRGDRPARPEGGAVSRAIREHLRDFVAIGILIVLAIVTTGVILVAAVGELPILDSDPRLRQLRAQGRVHDRAGGDARARASRSRSPGSRWGHRGGRRSSRTAPRS